jgi:DNA-binding transcriptional MerR regulator
MNTIERVTMTEPEYSASEIRTILLDLFPHRKLVLSQFTFFVQAGVAEPTGETFRRGRRCYRLNDLLPIACVLALKERGIPLKHIVRLPEQIRENADMIMGSAFPCWITGYGEETELALPGQQESALLDKFLDNCGTGEEKLFWRFDLASLGRELLNAAHPEEEKIAVAA